VTEKNFLADTSFLIDLEAERPEAIEIIAEENVSTGTPSVFELQKLGSNENIQQIGDRWIHEFTVEDAAKASEIFRKISVNSMDCMIAAQAINRDLTLLTADTDFNKIEDSKTEYYRDD